MLAGDVYRLLNGWWIRHFVVTLAGQILFGNTAAERLFGYPHGVC